MVSYADSSGKIHRTFDCGAVASCRRRQLQLQLQAAVLLRSAWSSDRHGDQEPRNQPAAEYKHSASNGWHNAMENNTKNILFSQLILSSTYCCIRERVCTMYSYDWMVCWYQLRTELTRSALCIPPCGPYNRN